MNLLNKRTVTILVASFLLSSLALGQKTIKDTAFYKQKKVWGQDVTVLTMDFSKLNKPTSLESFSPLFHFPPVRQDTTGTCWSFSATSFFESELKRLGRGEIKLSEMFPVYYEYIEKARRFVKEKGNSNFAEGSESEAVIERMKQHGAVRESDYSGLLSGQTRHNHSKMFREMNNYLNFVKANGYWDEEQVMTNIRMILNRYMGQPPETINVDGKKMTPKEYFDIVLRLPLDDYIPIMSFKYLPFYTKGEFKVGDNWWHSKEYYNVPLDEFYNATKNAVLNGFTVCIGGDVSEPGKSPEDDIFIVPSFDLPQDAINQDSREFRFDNKTSGDDHGIHIVGYTNYKGHDWFLIKDSGSGAFEGKMVGYYMYRDDYVKLKMLSILVHRDAVKDLMKKFAGK
jgi:bleomycin hydrolase